MHKMTAAQIIGLTDEQLAAMSPNEYANTLKTLCHQVVEKEKANQTVTVRKLKDKLSMLEKHPAAKNIAGGIQDIRRQDWEINHTRIKAYIRNHLIEYKSVPNVTDISNAVGLSRQTVYEHINEGVTNEFYQEHLRQLEYLTVDILQLLYLRLLEGNTMAGKVYLDYVSKVRSIRQQNNYIQVNNLVLDEQKMNMLPEDDKMRIDCLSDELRKIITKHQPI